MTDLRKASDEDLRAELERRALPRPPPPGRVLLIEWESLEKMIEDYVVWVASDKYNDDENGDWRVHIAEAAITAVVGPAFWTWKRAVRP